ncbi:unnamed protein product [Adineta ricciae]|uniref:Uncharacterized protein n=1 Tax=Adineta ricciae TaxID=249248 RepID=A0A814BZ45_ADIRI|nr:unnamed protein product [Adineta ricciae]
MSLFYSCDIAGDIYQKEEHKDEIDLELHRLELEWRGFEIQSMRAKVKYYRYLSQKVDELSSQQEIVKIYNNMK